MSVRPPRLLLTSLLCCAALSSAAGTTLYARLGGQSGVAAIADTLIDRAANDPVAGRSFAGSNLNRIKTLLAEQLCDLSGGPCHYSGDPMKQVHGGHRISEAEFNRMVESLQAVLKERHVDLRSRNQLLRLLAPMKRDIVEHAQITGQTRTPGP
ncbi:MAG: group 1 truncated hemoglobin [Pseudomonadota bacterium]|nr:group 1 truncated hemoglobin [Pseudomonadota bacterium]